MPKRSLSLYLVTAFVALGALFAHAEPAAKETSATPAAKAVSSGLPAPVSAMPPVELGKAKHFNYTPRGTEIVMGQPKAPIVIVEYASLSCPHCAHFFREELPPLTKRYLDTGKARLVYRDYPLNEQALRAAELVQCADKSQQHTFLKVLFSTQNKWMLDSNYKDALAGIAALGGIERARFNACLLDKSIEKALLEQTKEAEEVYKVTSTPTFFVDGELVPGDHSAATLGKAIDKALAARNAKK